jgi:hypothetical protein
VSGYAYRKAWANRNRDKVRAAGRASYHRNKAKNRTRQIAYWEKDKAAHRERNLQSRIKNKTQVLSHYGPNQEARCAVIGCNVDDLDMLTLDHLENDGATHRRAIGSTGGQTTYRWIIRNGFPEGFQTLCWNHQFKKELARVRAIGTVKS